MPVTRTHSVPLRRVQPTMIPNIWATTNGDRENPRRFARPRATTASPPANTR